MTKFMHLRKIKSNEIQAKGGITIAYTETITGTGTKRIDVVTAQCSRNDVFNKKIGRNVSEGRLHTRSDLIEEILSPVEESTAATLIRHFGKKDLQPA